jgi:Tfp pilus assembly protein FimT
MKHARKKSGGFTLTEVLIASAISLTVLGVTLAVYGDLMRSWRGVELRMDADREVNIAMSRMVYGMDGRFGLRAARSSSVTVTETGGGWTVAYSTGGTAPQNSSFTWSAASRELVFNPGGRVAGQNISYATAALQGASLVVTLRVDRVRGPLAVRREVETEVFFRNR